MGISAGFENSWYSQLGLRPFVQGCRSNIPHSNAGEERIFSLINKNKTPSRSSLNLDGTLSSLIVVKTHIDNPLQWKPSESQIQKAKKATKEYNDQHKR